MDELGRVLMTIGCRDCDPIPKVSEAGRILEDDADHVQVMHNGLRVIEGGYYGSWMSHIIRALRGHHEPQEELLFHHLLRAVRHHSLIVELGCFWSYYSLWFLSEIPGSRALGVEPDPSNLAVGRQNAVLNGLSDRMTFVRGCIGGSFRDAVEMRMEATGGVECVPCFDMAAVSHLAGGAPIELLHIDAQGAELDFLRSIDPAAAGLRFVVVSTHHSSISGSPTTHADCLAALAAAGAAVLAEHDVQEIFQRRRCDRRELPRAGPRPRPSRNLAEQGIGVAVPAALSGTAPDMSLILHAYKVYRPEVEGGIPAVIHTLASGLGPPFAHEVLVARNHGAGRRGAVSGVPVRRVGSLGTFWSLPVAPGYPGALARAARRADLVALHAPFPLADLGLIAAGRTPLVVHWHAEIARQRRLAPVYGPLMRRTLDRASAIIVAHARVAEASAQLVDFADRIRVVPYGLDPGPWTALDEEDRAEIARLRAAEPCLFVAVGRLVGYKGYDVLIRAARDAGARIMICGTGGDEDRLRRLIAETGAGDRVTIEGLTSQRRLRQLLHAARALIMPSVTTAEAFGLAQVEAMFCGTAVVNTDLPTAVPWVARHEWEALTVPPGDARALAAALGRIATEPGLADRLGAAGRRRALELFSAEAFCAAIGEIYRAALRSDGA